MAAGLPRLPTQLTLRLTLLLCLLLGANTVIFVQLYRHNLRHELAPAMGRAIADWVQLARASDSSLSDQERIAWLQHANEDRAHRIDLIPAGADDEPKPGNPFGVHLENALRDAAGNDVHLEQDFVNKTVKVHFNSGDRHYVLTLPGSDLSANNVWPFVWLIAANFVIVWLCVLFAASQIEKPLQRSAAALASSADRMQEISLPASAPREFRIFAQRFNELARRLAAQERERALLLAGVSHDLRAPLTRIQLRAELMEESQSGSANGLAIDAQSMRHIIDQFLAYQRGTVAADARLIELRMATRDIVDRYCETGHDVRFSGEDSALVLADPSAIERILGNLIDNAFDYGRAPVEVSIAVEPGHANLEVRDHGPGIDARQVERLLQPFERLDDSRSLHGHCGLGLSIVSRLVKDLGGSLAIDNHPQGGLRARVKLPSKSAET